jgi:hypothetical protein
MRKTPEQIAALAESCSTPLASVRLINRLYRAQDESHLWPIRGRFNATERAIRRIRQHGCVDDWGPGYVRALEAELSDIVNSEI